MIMPGVAAMNNIHHPLHDPANGTPHHVRPDSAHDDSMDMDDAEHELDDMSSKPKKKRRVIKTTDKKYECPQPDCGKSYSRAEHLYRHQLNRSFAPLLLSYSTMFGIANVAHRHTQADISLRLPRM